MEQRQTDGIVTLGAVGDIGFHGVIGEAMLRHGHGWPFEPMRPHLRRADLLFGNMESVAIPADFPPERLAPKALVSKVSGAVAARALREAGFAIMNMAANHVLDAGTVGLRHTRRSLIEGGLKVGGVGETPQEAQALQVVECKGLRLGFLCYCEQNNCTLQSRGPTHAYYEVERVVADVRTHRQEVDILVVSIHADIEFTPAPSLPRLRNSRRIAEAGASLILQHHPHVPQGIEMHGGCLIAYSLGNFVFPAHTSPYMRRNGPHTAESMLLLVQLNRRGVQGFERVPVVIGTPPDERPLPADTATAARLQEYFSSLDQILQDEAEVRRIWRETACRFLSDYVGYLNNRGQERAGETLLQDILPRFLYVAENRNVMDEVAAMAHEAWQGVLEQDTTWQRPRMG